MKKTGKLLALVLMLCLWNASFLVSSAGESEPYVSLTNVTELKAGETGVINVRTNRKTAMNSFEFAIALTDDKVEMTTAPADEGQYDFFADSFTYTGGLLVSNFDAGKKQVLLTGCNSDAKTAQIEAGTIIAKITIKAKVDLAEGDVIATLTNKYMTALDEVVYVENETAQSAVVKAASVRISLELCGGEGEKEVTVFRGEAVNALPKPAKRGTVFAGWYTDASYETEFAFGNSPEQDMTLYAKWVLRGDVDGNGRISAEDALMVLKRVANIISPDDFTGVQNEQANVNDNDGIDAEDALKILKRVANMITEL